MLTCNPVPSKFFMFKVTFYVCVLFLFLVNSKLDVELCVNNARTSGLREKNQYLDVLST